MAMIYYLLTVIYTLDGGNASDLELNVYLSTYYSTEQPSQKVSSGKSAPVSLN